MCNLLQSKRSKKLIFDENLFDSCIGGKFETSKEFVSALDIDLDSIVLTETTDLLKFSLVAINKD